MKDALFVAYHYPPMIAGSARVKGLVRYLPELGYQPHILTATTYGKEPYPQVYRAHELLGLYRLLFNWKQRDLPSVQRSFDRTRVWGVRNFVRQCKRLMLVPDGQMGWLPHALWVGLRLIRQHRIQVLYSTAPPFSSHLLAMGLQMLTGLPWVADFRDTWTYDPLEGALLDLPMRLKMERWMEKMVLRRANRVIVVTDVAREDFANRYPSVADRLMLIPNGFDPEDLPEQTTPTVHDGRFRVVYTGSFSHSHISRSPTCFFEGVKQFVNRQTHWAQILEIVIVGSLSVEERRCATELVQAGIVKLVGSVSRREAIAWQQRADVLLLVDHIREVPASNIPGKCYEYLASHKPIFALVPEGATRRLVEALKAGICVFPDDVDAIDKGLERLLTAQSLDAWRVPGDHLLRFHHRTTSAQLAQCFDEIIKT
ncbi:MAG: glycosyltransferase involved in cell wall biosynthesis [Candidatus Latescibacterota bacterium]|jgi:glycosyltransferase involved in cell wall biosynthesis